jgi:Tol biopolymer transport system component
MGTLQVTVVTNGATIDRDGDGYRLFVDNQIDNATPLADGTTSLSLNSGTHKVQLGGLQANCTVDESDSRMLEIVGGQETAISFHVSCAANIGTLKVETHTTGDGYESNAYAIVVPSVGNLELNANDVATLENLRARELKITLDKIPVGCFALINPQTAYVLYNKTTVVAFNVRCPPAIPAELIAYASERLGNVDIYVIRSDGINPVRLTTDAQTDQDPAWSAQRDKIAFASNRDGNFEIYTMNADGSNQQRITYSPRADYRPTWSPDGKTIAFVSERNGSPEIYSIDIDGKNEKRLTNDGYNTAPDWSPDGKQIVFSRDNGGFDFANGLRLMDANGSNVRQLTTAPRGDLQPVWSPDGTTIAYVAVSYYTSYIQTILKDGATQRTITDGNSFVADPSWSADGRSIVYGTISSICYYIYSAFGQCIPFIAVSSSSGESRPFPQLAPATNPAWQR